MKILVFYMKTLGDRALNTLEGTCKYNVDQQHKAISHLDSFQYAATSNLGKTRVAFSNRAMPTPSQNCTCFKTLHNIALETCGATETKNKKEKDKLNYKLKKARIITQTE